MLFSITVSYSRPPEEVKEHLDGHKDWLVHHIKSSNIIVAGPLQSGDGGFILAHAEDLSAIETMIAEDPFDRHRVAAFDVQVCNPAIRAAGFPEQWAASARSV